MQLCGVASVDLCLTTGHHCAARAAYFNSAKGGLQLLSNHNVTSRGPVGLGELPTRGLA